MPNFDVCGSRGGGGCREAIQWVTSPAGKALPVDSKPITSQEDSRAIAHRKAPLYTILGDRAYSHGNADVAFQSAKGQPLFISHFVTCTKRDKFRR